MDSIQLKFSKNMAPSIFLKKTYFVQKKQGFQMGPFIELHGQAFSRKKIFSKNFLKIFEK